MKREYYYCVDRMKRLMLTLVGHGITRLRCLDWVKSKARKSKDIE